MKIYTNWRLLISLKMPGPISQNGIFYSNDASSPKLSWFQISFKSVKQFGHKKRLRFLQLPMPYCVSLIMVTITSHIFINIFQTVPFSAVKFTRGIEKNMSFLLIPKFPKVWEKSEAIGPGTFNYHYIRCQPSYVHSHIRILCGGQHFFLNRFWLLSVFFFFHWKAALTEGKYVYNKQTGNPSYETANNMWENPSHVARSETAKSRKLAT